MAYVNTPLELAKCLAGMSYSGLLDVAREFVAMNLPETGVARDVGTPHGMADTLADWADAKVEEAEEEAKIAKLAAGPKAA